MVGGPERAKEPSVAVVGLWHLGVVIAACLAQAGASRHRESIPIDAVVAALNAERPPVYEPGLSELLREVRSSGRLTFDCPSSDSVGSAEYVWIAFDTPVDDEDRADVDWVLERRPVAHWLARHPGAGGRVLPAAGRKRGKARKGEWRATGATICGLHACRRTCVSVGHSRRFRSPDRFVAGVRSPEDAAELERLIGRFGSIEWMRVESAEMTKHALNAFLATSVAFINEIATICERVGADAFEVARGLKSEQRIGPARISPAG